MITVIKKGSSSETIRQQYREHKKRKKEEVDIHTFCGSINLKKDIMELQKSWRDEWE